MRISTSGIHDSALQAMFTQQTTLSKTQSQVASGRRVQTPADDPVAAVHIMELERALREAEQLGKNADVAKNRLTLEEQSLADVSTLLHRVRELTLQGNNSTLDGTGRRMIATEIRGRFQELMDIANRRDANGEYLFSGLSSATRPFTSSAGAISYAGDQGNRVLQIGPTQRVADAHSGFDVFMDISEGNGVFVTDAGGANTGTGVITGGSVVNFASWVADDYTLRFTSANAWEVRNSSAAVVATGSYTDPGAIVFNGVSVNLSGAPASGDTFSISRSRTEDLFTTVDRLATALESSADTQAQRAQFNTDMARALQQIEQSTDHISSVRSQIGTRLSSIDTTAASRDDQKIELQRMTSELRDLDYAEAITRMNKQLVGLEAAQSSYSRIAQLSLFNYLR